jgi:hypothetical protein
MIFLYNKIKIKYLYLLDNSILLKVIKFSWKKKGKKII